MTKREDMLEIHPDQNRLDEEWGKQSRLRLSYGFMRADARKELSQCKAELEVTESELKLTIRDHPEKFGLAKITEDAVRSTLVIQDEYKDALGKVISAQHEVDVIDAALAAIDDRKHTLEDWVKLYLSGYFSDPKAPEDGREEWEERTKQAGRMRGREQRDR